LRTRFMGLEIYNLYPTSSFYPALSRNSLLGSERYLQTDCQSDRQSKMLIYDTKRSSLSVESPDVSFADLLYCKMYGLPQSPKSLLPEQEATCSRPANIEKVIVVVEKKKICFSQNQAVSLMNPDVEETFQVFCHTEFTAAIADCVIVFEDYTFDKTKDVRVSLIFPQRCFSC